MARHGILLRERRPQGDGWSLIELLLAGVLFLVALLAATPLFMRAVQDVRTGGVRSTAAILAQNGLERASLAAASAVAPETSRVEYYSFERREWMTEPPAPPDRALWVRETSLRRYRLGAAADGRLAAREAAPAGQCPPPESPRLCLVAIRVEVSRRLGGRPIASLERLEWTTG